MKGRVIVKDNIGNNICVNMLDPRYINGEYKPVNSGKCFYKDKNNNIVFTSINDSRVLSGELIHTTRGRITVKDKNGNFYSVYKNDPRLLSGELVFNCTGHKLSEETKQKLSKNHKDNAGVKNGQYGKHWYHMKINGKMLNKMLSDNEYQMYKQDGWIKGSILNKDIHGKIQKNDI